MSFKKRKYDDSYMRFGFTSIMVSNEDKPLHVLCNKIISKDSIRPVNFKQHLENLHLRSKNKDKSFFKHDDKVLRKIKLDSSGEFCLRNNKLLHTSYLVVFQPLRWPCVKCVIHHEQDVREEQQYICGVSKQ